MGKVVFSGHGGFETSTNPPWVTVPDGTTLYFYSDNMKALLDSNGQTVETMSAALDSASPSQVVYGGQRCPNYTLYPPTGLDIEDSPDDVEQIVVSSDVTLEQLFAWPGVAGNECYWAACRVVELAEVGGEYLGVNAAQIELGGDGAEFDPDDPDVATFVGAFASMSEEDREKWWAYFSEKQRHGAGMIDETIRQWAAQREHGSLTGGEMDGFFDWWQTASEEERNAAWVDLTQDQQEQLRARFPG